MVDKQPHSQEGSFREKKEAPGTRKSYLALVSTQKKVQREEKDKVTPSEAGLRKAGAPIETHRWPPEHQPEEGIRGRKEHLTKGKTVPPTYFIQLQVDQPS